MKIKGELFRIVIEALVSDEVRFERATEVQYGQGNAANVVEPT